MRKLITLSAILLAITVSAREISPDKAASVASEFLNINYPAKSKVAVRQVHSKGSFTSATHPYYVFNKTENQGFVIVAGDDRVQRILGFADNGSFDFENMPPQLTKLLELYTEHLKSLSDNAPTHTSWSETTTSSSSEESVLLETANWNQNEPYNSLFPTIDGIKAPTGCTATAMAIVMKYHNWPQNYNWDAMPIQNVNETNSTEIAKLMKDAAEAVFMNYSKKSSGAYQYYVAPRLTTVFHYSPDCRYIKKKNCTDEEWTNLLHENLKSGNPLIYGGRDLKTDSGHSFIIDGYLDDKYHINWGWSGLFNGYYALDALIPSSEGSTPTKDYSYESDIIVNIEPDRSGLQYSDCYTDNGYAFPIYEHLNATGNPGGRMNISVKDVVKGEPFSVFNSEMTACKGFVGDVSLALVDQNGKIKEILGSEWHTTYNSADKEYKGCGFPFISFTDVVVSSEIAPTDRIQLVTKHENDEIYKLVNGTVEWPSSVSVKDNKPQTATVNFEIDPGVKIKLNRYSGLKELPSGKSSLQVFVGESIAFIAESTDNNSDGTVIYQISGSYSDQALTEGSVASLHIYGQQYNVNIKYQSYSDRDIEVTAPGTLNELISMENAHTVKRLVLKGRINAKDIWYIRDNFQSVETLDLSACVIASVTACDDYTSKFGDAQERLYDDNTFPEYGLVEKSSLKWLYLPENLTDIESNSLMNLNLTEIKIPAGVKQIGLNVFFGNENLAHITVLNPEPVQINECIFTATKCPDNGELFVPEGSKAKYEQADVWNRFFRIMEGEMSDNPDYTLTDNGIRYFCDVKSATVIGYEGEISDVIIPDAIYKDGIAYNVTEIKDQSFIGCQTLRSIQMTDNITKMGDYIFTECTKLESVKLSESISKIPFSTFAGCTSLENIRIPESVIEISNSAFSSSGLKRIYIPKNASPADNSTPFRSLKSSELFEVHPDNKSWVGIDGLLYRITDRGPELEAIPCKMKGIINIADGCTAIRTNCVCECDLEAERIVVPASVSLINTNALEIDGELIEFMGNTTLAEGALLVRGGSVTFHAKPVFNNKAVWSGNGFNNAYVDFEGEINLTGLSPEMNIYTSSLKYLPEFDGKGLFFVAACTATDSEAKAMYRYIKDEKNKCFHIASELENVEITQVKINEVSYEPNARNLYFYSEDTLPEITVYYTVNHEQTLSTTYSSDFNETLKSQDLTDYISDIEDIKIIESEDVTIYSISGVIVYRGNLNCIENLSPGIYIISQDNRTAKFVIK